MPTVRLRPETYEALQALAAPFVDTPDAVVQRLLVVTRTVLEQRDEPVSAEALAALVAQWGDDADAAQHEETPPPEDEGKTASGEFRSAIVEALQEMGGSGKTNHVLDRVGELLQPQLTAGDLKVTTSGNPRWRSAAQAQHAHLVQEGVLRDDAPTGIWRLTSRTGHRNLAATRSEHRERS